VDLDQVSDELYAGPPGRFVAERDRRAVQARAQGDAGLATAIKKLRKPTVGAWLANQVSRQCASEVDQLIGLGTQLRTAQRQLAGDQLRQLSARRQPLVAALCREGLAIGRRAGAAVSPAAADELRETLEAAMADPEAGDALRAGRLSTALRYAGTGLDLGPATGAHADPRPGRTSRRPDDATRARRAGLSAQAKAAGRRASAVRRSVENLRHQLAQVSSSLTEVSAHAERLRREMGDLEERLSLAERQLLEAQREETAAHQRLSAG
jgi:hypothetical protein